MGHEQEVRLGERHDVQLPAQAHGHTRRDYEIQDSGRLTIRRALEK
jgi:hypothetical protein